MGKRSARRPDDELRARVRAAGLRATGSRLAVLKRLRAADTPLTHAELAAAVSPQGWDRTTVYRNLTALTEAGITRRIDVGDHVWRFELRGQGRGTQRDKHPHFVCAQCGDVVCLPGVRVKISTSSAKVPRALASEEIEVQLKGYCDRCA